VAKAIGRQKPPPASGGAQAQGLSRYRLKKEHGVTTQVAKSKRHIIAANTIFPPDLAE